MASGKIAYSDSAVHFAPYMSRVPGSNLLIASLHAHVMLKSCKRRSWHTIYVKLQKQWQGICVYSNGRHQHRRKNGRTKTIEGQVVTKRMTSCNLCVSVAGNKSLTLKHTGTRRLWGLSGTCERCRSTSHSQFFGHPVASGRCSGKHQAEKGFHGISPPPLAPPRCTLYLHSNECCVSSAS